MENIINQFYEDLSEKISKTYNQELFSVFDKMPRPIINFNDVELLKKAQLYIRHTDLVFTKCIARLVQKLFEQQNKKCSTPNDSFGKCAYVHSIKTRFHFPSIEKFAGFPHVSWMKEIVGKKDEPGMEKDLYVVMINSDETGLNYIDTLNSYINREEIKFYAFEEFIKVMFGANTWELIYSAFIKIQKNAEELQWFELARTASTKNIDVFIESIKEEIKHFDYDAELSKTTENIKCNSFELIGNRYINNNLYLKLFEQNDFSKSFLTSEWLYKNQMKNDFLDKTYVITGYLKSVEQLLFSLISNSGRGHTISIASSTGIRRVEVGSPDFYNVTLGNMVYFLKDLNNKDLFASEIGKKTIPKITRIINNWVQSERNGYFHKHNMNSIDKINEIRNNTLLLYYLILGSLA